MNSCTLDKNKEKNYPFPNICFHQASLLPEKFIYFTGIGQWSENLSFPLFLYVQNSLIKF